MKLEIESFEDGNDYSETLARAKFEELDVDLFRKTVKPVEQVLKYANMKKDDVDKVCRQVASDVPNRLTLVGRLSSSMVRLLTIIDVRP